MLIPITGLGQGTVGGVGKIGPDLYDRLPHEQTPPVGMMSTDICVNLQCPEGHTITLYILYSVTDHPLNTIYTL